MAIAEIVYVATHTHDDDTDICGVATTLELAKELCEAYCARTEPARMPFPNWNTRTLEEAEAEPEEEEDEPAPIRHIVAQVGARYWWYTVEAFELTRGEKWSTPTSIIGNGGDTDAIKGTGS